MIGLTAAVSILNLFNFSAWAGDQPRFKKVMIVVLENTDYEDALNQPYLSKLASEGASFSQFTAETHPSQPNYIAMISGDTQGVRGDGNANVSGKHIGDLLEAAGKSWKVYAEDYPGQCFQGSRANDYARKHVPFISFTNVSSNPASCARIVNSSQLDLDIAAGALPDFSFYVPNLKNDGHDTGASFADSWLSTNFKSRLVDPKFSKDLLFITTFDESDNFFGSNQIYTSFYGDSVIPGSKISDATNHYSILRLIEETLGLGSLGQADASASVIHGIWK